MICQQQNNAMTPQETFQTENAVKIQLLLKRIQEKSENFYNDNKGTWLGDLGYVADQLSAIDSFLSDSYLNPKK